jgi:hypothetical protein
MRDPLAAYLALDHPPLNSRQELDERAVVPQPRDDPLGDHPLFVVLDEPLPRIRLERQQGHASRSPPVRFADPDANGLPDPNDPLGCQSGSPRELRPWRERIGAVGQLQLRAFGQDACDHRSALRSRLGNDVRKQPTPLEGAADPLEDGGRLAATVDEEERVVERIRVAVTEGPPDPNCAAVDVQPGRQTLGELPRQVAGREHVDGRRVAELGAQRRGIEEGLGGPGRDRDADDRVLATR